MAQTTVQDAIKFNRNNPDAIIAAGELVDMRFKSGGVMSLRAAKLFCLLVQQAGVEIADDKQHVVPYSVINETFHKSRDELVEAIEELHSTTVSIHITSRKGRSYTKSGPILSDVERDDDDQAGAEIRFEFSPTLRRVIADSTHWAAISRRAVLAFESKYSLRLYMYLSLRAGLRKTSEDLTIEDMREILGVSTGALTRWQDFSRFALDKAVAEINHLAGFRAGYIPIKRGRKIEGIRLTWGRKAGEELVEAHKELERHRTGRIARRDDKVEAIAQEHAALRHSLASTIAAAPYDSATVAQPQEPNDRQPK
jgi:plasmid replication initiation protein